MYRIVRHYFSAYPAHRTIRRNLTLSEEKEHCQNPETSSSTAVGSAARRITRRMGAWFDGYESEGKS